MLREMIIFWDGHQLPALHIAVQSSTRCFAGMPPISNVLLRRFRTVASSTGDRVQNPAVCSISLTCIQTFLIACIAIVRNIRNFPERGVLHSATKYDRQTFSPRSCAPRLGPSDGMRLDLPAKSACMLHWALAMVCDCSAIAIPQIVRRLSASIFSFALYADGPPVVVS